MSTCDDLFRMLLVQTCERVWPRGPIPLPWSSYAANVLGEDNCIVSSHDEYLHLEQTLLQRQEAYYALFDAELTVKELERIRNCTKSGTPIGNKRFKERIEKTLNRRVGCEKRGGPGKTSVAGLSS